MGVDLGEGVGRDRHRYVGNGGETLKTWDVFPREIFAELHLKKLAYPSCGSWAALLPREQLR